MSEVTAIEHLIASQRRWSPQATGQFTSLMHDLILSAKIISRNVNQAGLVDILGATGAVNVQGEQVQKLDTFANNTLVYRMQSSGAVCAVGSEEMAEPFFVPENEPHGHYVIFFDPLDGSSNIDVGVSIGTIFSIYRRSDTENYWALNTESLMRPGLEQAAAGHFPHGSPTLLVYSTGHGVNGFTLDSSIGEFLLTHPNIQIPRVGKYYSANHGYYNYWDEATQKAVHSFSRPDGMPPRSTRYVGSLVADFHRTLLKGGVFFYTEDSKHPNGKLRLMYEAAPMAFLAEQAGGKATDGRMRILEKVPTAIHERTPLIIGSTDDVDQVLEVYRENGKV